MTDRDRWNARYRKGEAQSSEPDPLLLEVCGHLPPGRALDLAGGAGRNALWLARRGWRVLLSDIAEEGLKIAALRAEAAEVPVEIRCESIDATMEWARCRRERFELVIVFRFLAREHFSALPQLLVPGGTLIYKTFTSEHPRFMPGEHPRLTDEEASRFALRPGELRTAFPALEEILCREKDGVAELVARAS